jgi:hypothetical protein
MTEWPWLHHLRQRQSTDLGLVLQFNNFLIYALLLAGFVKIMLSVWREVEPQIGVRFPQAPLKGAQPDYPFVRHVQIFPSSGKPL